MYNNRKKALMNNHILTDMHLIATDKESQLVMEASHGQGFINGLKWDSISHIKHPYGGNWLPFELYLTSDEEIKKGDWCMYIDGGSKDIRKVKYIKENDLWFTEDTFSKRHNVVKIIATTTHLTQSLGEKVRGLKLLPKIPQDLISLYIKRYNEGSPLKQVWLETEDKVVECPDGIKGCEVLHLKKELKLNSDGSVIWTIGEEKLYIREELKKAFSYYAHSSISQQPYNQKDLDREFDKNYPE